MSARRWMAPAFLAALATIVEACILDVAPPLPAAERCDGATAGERCCAAGETAACYSGPAATKGVGACVAGQKSCNESGTAFGACAGEVTPSVEDCSTDADEDCNGKGCSGEVLWAHAYGDDGEQSAHAVAVDSRGAVILTGQFTGTLTLDRRLQSRGGFDVFVGKLSPDGEALWSLDLGGSMDDGVPCGTTVDCGRGPSVAVDGDDAIYVGSTVSGAADLGGSLVQGNDKDAFVLKLDPSGKLLWAKRWGDADAQSVDGLAVDARGDVVITGSVAGTLDLGGQALTSAGAEDVFIAKLDASGNPLWSHRYGDAASQYGKVIAVDRDGNVVVLGVFSGTLDFGGETHALKSDPNGTDVFVAKLDASGKTLWARRFGPSSAPPNPNLPTGQDGTGVAVDSKGGIVITGWYDGFMDLGQGVLLQSTGDSGQSDVFVAGLAPNGDTLWGKTFGNQFDLQVGWGVAVDARDQVVVAGNLTGTVDFGHGILHQGADPDTDTPDGMILKLDRLGVPIWERRIGGPGWQAAYGVAISREGNPVVVGRSDSGDLTSLHPTLKNAGGNDAWIVKLMP